MSFAASSLNTFRSCTAAISARSLARPAIGRYPTRLSRLGQESKGECSELETKLKAKEGEVTDLTSRLRYLQADFLNLQRNAAREKEQTRDFAITKFAGDLLETVDVLTIALKSDHATYLKELHTGVEMTQRLLQQTLFKYHVKPFDPTGDVFDPNHHEALYQAPVPGKEPGTVIDCQKIGYKIKDRVLRAAQVGVAQDTS
ncbi:GrpE-domain-containing protein [Pholiota molesta]|nr:GrpE-domain-containing protein [Pholiota molesta]